MTIDIKGPLILIILCQFWYICTSSYNLIYITLTYYFLGLLPASAQCRGMTRSGENLTPDGIQTRNLGIWIQFKKSWSNHLICIIHLFVPFPCGRTFFWSNFYFLLFCVKKNKMHGMWDFYERSICTCSSYSLAIQFVETKLLLLFQWHLWKLILKSFYH